MERPRLRPLEAVPVKNEGQDYLMLRDPLHLSDAVLFVPFPLVPILQRLEGEHTLEEIQEDLRRAFRVEVPMENLRKIVSQLGEAHFLDGEGFEDWRKGIEGAFLASPTRPSFLAGRSYADDPAELSAQIEEFFLHPDGPGPLERNGIPAAGGLRGAVAPHIDFQRGGPTFAWSYKAIAERADADLFVVLGTVHAPTAGHYVLTRKSFETPLGTLEVDGNFVDRLSARAPEDLFKDEFTQRAEHSLEFRAVLLQYLYQKERKIQFVPILVGSFSEYVHERRSPWESERVKGFVEALRETVGESERAGRKVCFLASVDLTHMGPQFGDPGPSARRS